MNANKALWEKGDFTRIAESMRESGELWSRDFVSPMTWGIESHVVERFSGAGIPKDKISFVRDTFTFNCPRPPSEFVDSFRKYYEPTMNAFAAAEENGRANDLQKELEILFNSQNKNPSKDTTSIPATFLRVTVIRD